MAGYANRIGGSAPGAGNTIVDFRTGVFIGSFSDDKALVLGNRIGCDVRGVTALPNFLGVSVGEDIQVGGSQPGEANIISGNFIGVKAGGPVTIVGNLIGLQADGTHALPNAIGIYALGDTTIRSNRIAFNGDGGIVIGIH